MTNIQAINLLKGLEQSLDDYCELNDEGKTAFRMAIAALELFGNAEQLPSAQPEIIHCKDCKWWDKQDLFLQGRCALLGIRPTGGWFCANADMRGENE